MLVFIFFLNYSDGLLQCVFYNNFNNLAKIVSIYQFLEIKFHLLHTEGWMNERRFCKTHPTMERAEEGEIILNEAGGKLMQVPTEDAPQQITGTEQPLHFMAQHTGNNSNNNTHLL